MKRNLPKWVSALILGTITAQGAITGHVQDELGAPVKDAAVVYAGFADTVKTDAEGNFLIPVGTVTAVITQARAVNYQFTLQNGVIDLHLSESSPVKLRLSDLRGRTISLYDGTLSRGAHALRIDQNIAAGVWILSGKIGESQFVRKMEIGGRSMISAGSELPSAKAVQASEVRAGSAVSISKKGFFPQTLTAGTTNSDMGEITLKRPDTWSYNSHDKGAGIDRPLLFPYFSANKMKITVTEADWKVFMDDMASRYGAKRWWSRTPDASLYNGSEGVGTVPVGENPVYIPVTIEFNGKKWEKVGLRCKGNASLSSSWNTGLKLPFKLTFDQFEEKYPETNDQRFYGIKQLTMYNGNSDASQLREILPGRLFKKAGVKISDRGLYEVTIDFGVGERYLGMYTAVEIPWGQTMEDLFGANPDSSVEGNIYKPEGPMDSISRLASKFGKGSIFNQTTFEKQNNYDKSTQTGDWSDVSAICAVLFDSKRVSDPAGWRADLEKRFNVPQFIRTLAVSAAIDAFDSYGLAPHNYYLYGNPADGGKINWTPYDLNWSFMGGNGRLPIDQSHVTSEEWPLVWFTMKDPVYRKMYWDFMKEFNSEVFITDSVIADIDAWWKVIKPSIMKEKVDLSQFYPMSYADNPDYWDTDMSGVETLKANVEARKRVIEEACKSH